MRPICTFLAALVPMIARAQTTEYWLRFPRAAHQEVEVRAEFRNLSRAPLRVQMARTAPGRYVVHDFAKHLSDLEFVNSEGRPLSAVQTGPSAWTIRDHAGAVTARYVVFGDRGDGIFSGIDDAKILLHPLATLVYAPELLRRPARVHLELPNADWRVMTQLSQTGDGVWSARSVEFLFDSPIYAGQFRTRQWLMGPSGSPSAILAVDDTIADFVVDTLAARAERILGEAAAVFGTTPRVDADAFRMILCFRAGCAFDGMEHRSSTTITASMSIGRSLAGPLRSIAPDFVELLGTVGMAVVPVSPNAPWLGENGFESQNGRVVVTGSVRRGSPLYDASIETGDVILRFAGVAVPSDTALAAEYAKLHVGDSVEIEFYGRAGANKKRVLVKSRPAVTVRLFEEIGRTPSAVQLERRNAWLRARR